MKQELIKKCNKCLANYTGNHKCDSLMACLVAMARKRKTIK